ncbi:MAG TPA: cytochrome b [Novosphingobium sp.]|nr:cytochrome b [Novosphingobium sp.]
MNAPLSEPALERAPTRYGYGRAAQAFHWVSAALLVVLVTLGLYCSWVGDGPVRSYLLDSWHKPLGLSVIALTVLRLAWKAMQSAVGEAEGLARWESVLSRITHWGLYAILLAMPLSGLLMSQGAGRPTSYFGLFELPQMLAVDPALGPREQYYYKLGKWLHKSVFEWALYLIVALHVAGAIKHRYIDGNRAFMRRMWGWRK